MNDGRKGGKVGEGEEQGGKGENESQGMGGKRVKGNGGRCQ